MRMTETDGKPLIGRDECERNIRAGYRRLFRIADMHRRGMADDGDFGRTCSEVLYGCFFGFLRDSGLQSRVVCGNWPGFMRDWRQWLRGRMPDRGTEDAEGEPWLFAFRSCPEGGAPGDGHARREAAPEDKAAFFDLMSAFDIPAEYFEPAPDDITDERIMGRIGGTGGPIPWAVFSDWKDADGLLTDPSPAGKSFTLLSGHGLKARVTIEGREEENGALLYRGTGVIEGDTSGRERSIGIEARGGGIRAVSYAEEEDDRAAYGAFPLWQRYLCHCRRKEEIRNGICRRLENRFLRMAAALKDRDL